MAGNIVSDDDERSFMIQVQYVKETLERFQLKCNELEKENKDFTSRYNELEKDKKDITDNLKLSVAAKQKKIDELEKQLESQLQAAEQDREGLELQHSQQKQKLLEQINEITSENTIHVSKIEEQKQQVMQLMQHLQNLKSMEKQLVSQKGEDDTAIHSLKLEAELEKAKILEGKYNRIDDLVKAKDVLEKQKAQHSKLKEHLHFLHTERMRQLKEESTPQDRNRELCVQRDNLKENINKIKQKIITDRKEVMQLSQNCQQLKVELKDLRITHQHKVAQIRQHQPSVFKERRHKIAKVDQLVAELEKERSKRRRLEGIMQDAAIILRYILMDSEKSETQWNTHRLLEILEYYAYKETDWTLRDSTKKSV